ncbi:MAG TPA: hypothetical protein V6C84_19265 [Coleofasciculaceae cyanobacterium]|jgi:hypothetical protein
MLAIRIIPILLILSGMVLFALQNLSPALPLVILGTPTLALPLALWIGGAIAAGAITTLLISGLSGLGRPARRPVSRPAANRFSGGARPANPSNPFARRPVSPASTRLQDDWETGGQTKEEWDDWEEPQPRRSNFDAPKAGFRPPQPEIRDRTDDEWQNWDGYDNEPIRDRRPETEDYDFEPRVPPRTDFEVKRDPATRYQSGSVYSYGYSKSDDPDFEAADPQAEPPAARPGVYDAEYRVITPPYRPDPEEETAPAPADDWQAAEEALAEEAFRADPENQRDRRNP